MSNKFFYNKIYIIIALIFLTLFNSQAEAQGGISIGPPRIEAVIPAGTEKTVGYAVDYTRDFPEAELSVARLVARMEDWSLENNGDIKFAPVNTLPRSAASWVTFSPSEFNMAPDSRQIMRFTISVPKGTPPGDYYFASYVESRTPPPPPKQGERQISISFRYYTIFYVMVPDLTTEGELTGLDAQVVNGFPVISPQMENRGNSRLRPKHTIEIKDEKDKSLFISEKDETTVLLGGRSLKKGYVLESELPAGKYKVIYTIDFGDKKALQVGKTGFEISQDDVIARQKFKSAQEDEKLARNNEKPKDKIKEPDVKDSKNTSETPKETDVNAELKNSSSFKKIN